MAFLSGFSVRFSQSVVASAFLCAVVLSAVGSQATASSAPMMPSRADAFGTVDLPSFTDAYLPREKSEQHAAALNFIQKTGISKNLSLLLLHDVKNTAPVRAAIRRYGMNVVQATVVEVIRDVQADYGQDWNQMLAGIYESHFDARALQSLMQQRDASPYFVQLLDLQEEIATAVKTSGDRIFGKARADVMSKIKASLPI